ncbi:MAG: nucleoside/nucleotide kinase family protein [Actinomycetaceae bacterium]|nr:nucleoside/nucleotide kinase family protein [Actinomycetaceae bacterium]
MNEYSMEDLVRLATDLANLGGRRILGITGAPGAGKSTVAEELAYSLGPEVAVLLPMDGFHLSNEVLVNRGQREFKGAIQTFDATGYVTMLQRVKQQKPGDDPIVAPRFHREIEESICAEIEISAQVPLVITEGNYLLSQAGAWRDIAGLLDESWYLDLQEDIRIQRLIDRHLRFGKTPDEAKAWSLGSDQMNADLIASTRDNASRIVQLIAS